MISRYPNLSNESALLSNQSVADDDSKSVAGAESEKASFSNDL